MPRRRMMDRTMRRDGRNPYGSRGGYITSRDPRRRDRGMDYRLDMEHERMMDRNYEPSHYEHDGNRRMEGKTYYPIEAMGSFNGYWGRPQEDLGRGSRGRDYGYYEEDFGDYGETLTKDELEHWKHKLMKEVDEKDRHMFETSNIEQKAMQMGVKMKEFGIDELALVTLMLYTDYCKTLSRYVGNNIDAYIELAEDWLTDPDSDVKGAERLAIYHDEIIMGEDD